jgi:uncharacterized protein YjcR
MSEKLFEKLRQEYTIADNAAAKALDKYRSTGLAYYEAQKDRMKLAEIAAIIGVTPTTLNKWRKKSGFVPKKTVGNIGGRAHKQFNKKPPPSAD